MKQPHRLITVRSGRDGETEVLCFNTEADRELLHSRVAALCVALHRGTSTPIVGISDWKGNLMVCWGANPALRELALAQELWYAVCENLISHAVKQADGTWRAIKCEVQDTQEPFDIERQLQHLGLIP